MILSKNTGQFTSEVETRSPCESPILATENSLQKINLDDLTELDEISRPKFGQIDVKDASFQESQDYEANYSLLEREFMKLAQQESNKNPSHLINPETKKLEKNSKKITKNQPDRLLLNSAKIFKPKIKRPKEKIKSAESYLERFTMRSSCKNKNNNQNTTKSSHMGTSGIQDPREIFRWKHNKQPSRRKKSLEMSEVAARFQQPQNIFSENEQSFQENSNRSYRSSIQLQQPECM